MTSMRHVWALTVLGAALAAGFWWTFWDIEGERIMAADRGNDVRRALWVALQGGGDWTWLPWVLLPIVGALVAYGWGRNNYRARLFREQQQRENAAVPHPMD